MYMITYQLHLYYRYHCYELFHRHTHSEVTCETHDLSSPSSLNVKSSLNAHSYNYTTIVIYVKYGMTFNNSNPTKLSE